MSWPIRARTPEASVAPRRTAPEHRSFGKTAADDADDTDTFTFDEDGNILTAVKGRYNSTVTLECGIVLYFGVRWSSTALDSSQWGGL